ncbi:MULTISPECIES: arsenic transporter [Salinisphaera]|uniref:Arsenical pump membrane protein n=1 Tax=Salinisphaera hydrothermalis (strain C41B8) TaxID=1304275 RepID=A0A084IH36_SALHC|nr:arsenic transporter [Salinisphaera hydrothermalis]KEZ76020.1 arsenical pump membrane protein [Salinisphaera hydrothermalis C41B8]
MLALAIFVVTLVLVIWQPKNLGIGWSALGGAAIALATGVVQFSDVAVVWNIVWDATFTFVALIIISLILDEAGFFSWAALHIARWGNGRGHLLFPLIVLLGAVIAAFFANDGAALLLTPIVIAILVRLEFSASAALAFIIATGFIADTASLPLIISNLVNIVSANFFDVSFDRYAAVMVPVDLVSIATTLAVLWLYFGRRIPRRYPVDALDKPASAIVDPYVFRAALPVLAVLLVAYFVLARWHVPFCVVTGAGALVLLGLAGRWWRGGRGAVLPLGPVLRNAPWQIVLFSIGMYLVVYGLGQAGLTHYGATVLEWLGQQGPFVATLGTGFIAALVASVMNNMPSTLVGALAIKQAQVPELTHELMIYANVIGNDLGPKFTPIGSLATLLWLHVLAGKGYRIGWGQYMKVGLVLTPPVLLATLITLAIWLPLISM